MRRSIAIIAAAAVYVAAPAAADTAGFCSDKVGGAYPVPGESACSANYYMCSWDGATDAVAMTCPEGTKWLSNGGWSYYCATPAEIPACAPNPRAGLCAALDHAASFDDPNAPPCASTYWACMDPAAVDATVIECPAGQFVGSGPGAWGHYCTEHSEWIPACNTPLEVSPEGYCTGIDGSGAFADPNMGPTRTCSNTLWTCDWNTADDATVRSCPAGQVAKFPSSELTWAYECVAPSMIAGCSL